MSVRNINEIRKWSIPGVPDMGARLAETLRDMVRDTRVLAQQTNSNLEGNPSAPANLQGMNVVPHENGFDVAIHHDADIYRGIQYHVDYADNPAFQGARTWPMGETRNSIIPLGNRKLFFRAWAKYPNSDATPPVMHGGRVPVSVQGGTASPLLPTQGFGTSLSNQQSHQQPAWRSSNGAPPVKTP
jgi:hypothetical protein